MSTVARPPGRQFLDFLVSRLGTGVMSLATIAAVTRFVPSDTVGTFAAAVAYALLLSVFVDFGTGPVLVRSAADGHREHHITVFLWTRLVQMAAAIAVGALAVPVLFPAGSRAAGFTALAMVGSTYYLVTAPIGQVLGDSRPYRTTVLSQGLLQMTAVLTLLVSLEAPSAALLVAACAAAGAVVSVGAVAWAVRHAARVPARTIVGEVRRNLRGALVLGVGMSLAAIYYRIDQSLVLRVVGGTAAAEYGIAARILAQARLVPSALQLSIGALLARELQHDRELTTHDRHSLRDIAIFGGLGLSVAMIAVSDLAVLVIGGPAYDVSAVYVVLLGVALSLAGFVYVVVTGAIMASRDRLYLTTIVSAVVLNVVTNIALLSWWGAAGACIASILTEAFVVIAISRGLSAQRGGARTVDVLLVLAVSAAVGGAKLLARDVSLGADASVSLVLIVVAAMLLHRGYVSLQKLA